MSGEIYNPNSSLTIATYVRIKPPTESTKNQANKLFKKDNFNYHIQCKITNRTNYIIKYMLIVFIAASSHDGRKRDILEIEIPEDADPSLVHNSYTNDEGTGTMKFEFDRVFDIDTNQEDIFDIIAKERILNAMFKGINTSIFAYGQTSTGKVSEIMNISINYNSIY